MRRIAQADGKVPAQLTARDGGRNLFEIIHSRLISDRKTSLG